MGQAMALRPGTGHVLVAECQVGSSALPGRGGDGGGTCAAPHTGPAAAQQDGEGRVCGVGLTLRAWGTVWVVGAVPVSGVWVGSHMAREKSQGQSWWGREGNVTI